MFSLQQWWQENAFFESRHTDRKDSAARLCALGGKPLSRGKVLSRGGILNRQCTISDKGATPIQTSALRVIFRHLVFTIYGGARASPRKAFLLSAWVPPQETSFSLEKVNKYNVLPQVNGKAGR